MKLSSGKRIGQSGCELASAALFSFILHAIFFAAALLYLHAIPKKYTPPFYEVKLVGQPTESAEPPKAPLAPSQPAPPKQAKQEAKAAPKGKKAAPKTLKMQASKGAMPELARRQQKPVPAEPVKPEESLKEQPTAPATGTPGGATGPLAKGESVGMPTAEGFSDTLKSYLPRVRDNISRHWRPPPDAPDAKARVIFVINRSGYVLDVKLDVEHSNGAFGFKQAAVRAIHASNPLPPLPEEFSKQTLELSVDLTVE